MSDDGPVVVVTGGGAGIGAAVAEELGRQGAFVVTVDPLVSLDGTEALPATKETTADRIVATGGAARASGLSVTDADAVRTLFAELAAERGRLDAVVNVAGISRPTGFAKGTEDDWLAVLSVHLDGYRNVLAAALPIMASAGRGRILGVTSGSGWRAADAGAYACAKRAVAALTWELGRHAPPGVVVNAMSPIAVTRMVTAALGRAPSSGAAGSTATGGLSLGSMPQPEDLGPLAAHLVDEGFGWCSGAVVFAGGSEVAIVEPPRVLEVLRTDAVASLPAAIESASAGAWVPAEASQSSGGGGNPRFPGIGGAPADDLAPSASPACLVVSDRPVVAGAIAAALAARGVEATTLAPDGVAPGFGAAAEALASAGDPGAVVVALAGAEPAAGGSRWERILAEHDDVVGRIHADATWARAAAERTASTGRALRLVTVTDAATSGGRSRSQAAAQLARASRRATEDLVAAFAVADESGGQDATSVGALVAHLVAAPDALALSGAELVVGRGWAGLRSHPRPTGAIVLGSPELPAWFDDALRDALGAPHEDDAR